MPLGQRDKRACCQDDDELAKDQRTALARILDNPDRFYGATEALIDDRRLGIRIRTQPTNWILHRKTRKNCDVERDLYHVAGDVYGDLHDAGILSDIRNSKEESYAKKRRYRYWITLVVVSLIGGAAVHLLLMFIAGELRDNRIRRVGGSGCAIGFPGLRDEERREAFVVSRNDLEILIREKGFYVVDALKRQPLTDSDAQSFLLQAEEGLETVATVLPLPNSYPRPLDRQTFGNLISTELFDFTSRTSVRNPSEIADALLPSASFTRLTDLFGPDPFLESCLNIVADCGLSRLDKNSLDHPDEIADAEFKRRIGLRALATHCFPPR